MQQIGEFKIESVLAKTSSSVVYRALQPMGSGEGRSVCLKLPRSWSGGDTEADAHASRALEREVEINSFVGASPNVLPVHATGVDEVHGPWIAFELAAESLKDRISSSPAEPDLVRTVVFDTLSALRAIHGVDPQVIHRDVKPDNILRGDLGGWKLADFGVAKRGDSESTLELATVKYAAPELLDATRGEVGPAVDLYALGITAYELALGTDLWKKALPSVFGRSGLGLHRDEDLRHKWMFWHASLDQHLPRVTDLVSGFPADLADLLEALTHKSVEERVKSADEALEALQSRRPRPEPILSEAERKKKESGISPAIVALLIVSIMFAVSAGLYFKKDKESFRYAVDDKGRFEGSGEYVQVSGRLIYPPAGLRGLIRLKDQQGSVSPIAVAQDGSFKAPVWLAQLGAVEGSLQFIDGANRIVGSTSVVVERLAPKSVEFEFVTSPPVAGVEIDLWSGSPTGSPRLLVTGADGRASTAIDYGPFEYRAVHPRFLPLPRVNTETGFDPTASITIELAETPFDTLRIDIATEVERLVGITQAQTQCPPGPLSSEQTATRDVALKRLTLLGGADIDIAIFLDQVKNVVDCKPLTQPAVPLLPLDPDVRVNPITAYERVSQRVRMLLDRRARATEATFSDFEASQLTAALTALEEVSLESVEVLTFTDKVRDGAALDPPGTPAPVVAYARLRGFEPDIADSPEDDEEIAERGAWADAQAGEPVDAFERLLDEVEDLALRQANCPPGPLDATEQEKLLGALDELLWAAPGDKAISTYVDSVRAIKACSGAGLPDRPSVPASIFAAGWSWFRDRDLVMKAGNQKTSGEPGSNSSKSRSAGSMDRYLNTLTPGADAVAGAAGPGSAEVEQEIDRILTSVLTLSEFEQFLRANVPVKSVSFEALEEVDRVRLSGPLLSEEEASEIRSRVAGGHARIEDELRVDPQAVALAVERRLEEAGASSPRVDFHRRGTETLLFVSVRRSAGFGDAELDELVSGVALDRGTIRTLILDPGEAD